MLSYITSDMLLSPNHQLVH